MLCTFVFVVTASHASENKLLQAIAKADVSVGEMQSAICKACHSVEKGGATKLGPNLFNVVGSQIGADEEFQYSQALSSMKGVWSLDRLERFLADPQSYVPGIAMSFQGVKDPASRYAILAWLNMQSDKPVKLPEIKDAGDAVQIKEDPDMVLLPVGKGRKEVFYTCSVCHSIKLVVQQGLARYSWEETLDWMVDEQGMDALEANKKALILDYLSEHFGIREK